MVAHKCLSGDKLKSRVWTYNLSFLETKRMSNNVSTAQMGRVSEWLARQAFEALKERKLRGNIPQIVEVIPSEQNSEADAHSIDLLLKFHKVKQQGIQVRSSEWGRRRYLFRCARLGVEPLPVIVANWKDSLLTVLKRALRLLRIIFRPHKRNKPKLVRDVRDDIDTVWEKKLENKWWRRRKRRAPHRVRMAFSY